MKILMPHPEQRYTWENVKAWGPCDPYPQNDYALLRSLDGTPRTALEAFDGLRGRIPDNDLWWCLARKQVLGLPALQFLLADVAERGAPIFERARPDDMCVRDCVRTIRLAALGRATDRDLRAASAAADAASWAISSAAARAVRAAAKAAARAAADAARAAYYADDAFATYIAAYAAACAAACAAARAVAIAAAWAWMLDRLRLYLTDAVSINKRTLTVTPVVEGHVS